MTVTYEGVTLPLPPADVVARYAVAMYGEGHGPLDDGSDEALASLFSIAAQAQHDASR